MYNRHHNSAGIFLLARESALQQFKSGNGSSKGFLANIRAWGMKGIHYAIWIGAVLFTISQGALITGAQDIIKQKVVEGKIEVLRPIVVKHYDLKDLTNEPMDI
jgi:hypothetical protein